MIRRPAPRLLLAALLWCAAPAPAGAADAFGPPPERVQDLLLEAMRENESGDRDDTLRRLREVARAVSAEGKEATVEGARVLRDVLRDVDRASTRVHRGIRMSGDDLRILSGDVQEGLAYHFARRAEQLDARGLDARAAYARRLARIAAGHAARFHARPTRRTDQQLSDAGGRLLENTGRGLANVFRGAADAVDRVGRGTTGLVRPERPKRDDDPWR